MPQLIPFGFADAAVTTFVQLGFLIWFLSKVVLPIFPRLQISRLFVISL